MTESKDPALIRSSSAIYRHFNNRTQRLAFSAPPGDNQTVPETPIFTRGALVLVSLNTPREKFWGMVLELTTAGLGIRGMDLNSFDDFARLVREGEPAAASAVFFPMHRIERIELDTRNGAIPSLAERFESKSGRDCADVLGLNEISAERRP